ncbi:hypothetical protein OsJ_30340 [Oryza sativa Japonica Group]|uniref:Protein kinase domain-containing protein n=1 Tax=Oryza sativa subsp. japonica TaxID=39947 RepID=B9G528_ORYSJ|nr:hypothetical protein OsJ_30340 [Oryza sativa Japonica Group]
MVMLFPSPATAALLVLVVLLLQLQLWSAEAQVAVGSGPPAGCPDRCGNVSVPFPFGIRTGCSLEGFGLTCNTTSNPPRLMIGNSTLQVVSISLANSTLRAVDIAGAVNITYDVVSGTTGNGTWGGVAATSTNPYVVSGNSTSSSSRRATFRSPGNKCAGISCCQTPISIGRPSYSVKVTIMDNEYRGEVPEAIRIAELGWFDGLAANLLKKPAANDTSLRTPVPVVLEWAVASTGLDVTLDAGLNNQAANNWSCPTPGEARRSACISNNSYCHNVTDNYRSGYVCRCDDGYDGNPYVAGGCQDINECERPKEHGCFGECTNTPGAFLCRCPHGARGNYSIPNGCTKSNLARYLAYLHSAVSFPIIHRDIKSHNILLDGSLTTKVSDFGASRCIPAEQNGVTTAIQGTLGYLDPMYYYTGRLTEKSDIYSFGVVLMELLTRKKPHSYRSAEDESLVAHFTTLHAHGNLGDIFDAQVMEEGKKEVNEVAVLAVACVKLKAEERPTMRQVEMTLESIRSSSLQQEVLHSVSTKKSKELHVSWSHAISEGTSLDSTRQYSLEEENLLSSRYPR